ncbi:MAG: hypothetical protein HN742_30910 [Lentisphaerae bacterium]|jgi:beta-galactosidase|nr:hypothetical protein [Lentisphaerota bacterium]MBT4822451.1 hypothetical protein [Lentisphaerota bacterium]MBT5607948.1 hypothetical protein [Lentisphaerota bacterium]MBT7056532.1 hypothetical protein [Lentisphaerota bacterium]MBT7846323.1 hypothetical protein [Lentisphaerota bacterium]
MHLTVTSLLCLAVTTVTALSSEVRVRRTPGGPQVFVDGEAIAPRCFFGTRRGGLTAVAKTWQTCSFEFVPDRSVDGRGTLHLRFPRQPGQFWLRKIRIVDTVTGKDALPRHSFEDPAGFGNLWSVWPPGDANTVGTVRLQGGELRVTVQAPTAGGWPDFHLHTDISLTFAKGNRYRCEFEAKSNDATEIVPAVFCVEGGTWLTIGAPPGPFLPQIALARNAGIRLISTSMPACWLPPEQPPNWEGIDASMREIIAVHPQALIIPRVSANTPTWWLERHPEARMMFEGNKPGRFATVSSRKYRRDVVAHFGKLCRHLLETFPEHVAGIHPAGQNSAEWFYDKSWGALMSGYEPPTLAAWRMWLRQHGAEDAETAEIPSPEARHGGPSGVLLDPAAEQRLIQFNRFWQKEMADCVLEVAAACRRATQGKKLVVIFYGYLFEFHPLRNGAPYSGHYALSKVLKSPDIDILCSPISYTDRRWQGTAPCMTVAESVARAGKLWLNEDDTRTYLARTTQYGGVADLAQTRAVMLRNTAQAALRGFGTWWMDLPGRGWFNDPRIWEEHTRLDALDASMLRRKRPFQPEIAAIVDEESICHLSGKSNAAARPLVYDARAALGRCGAPYGQYLLDDVTAGHVPAKLQVFLTAWALSPKQRRELRKARRPGTTRIWSYAPGFLLADRTSIDGMRDVTGFEHRQIQLRTPVSQPTEQGRRHRLTEAWGQKTPVAPLFTVTPRTGDQVWATYSDGSPSVIVRRSGGGADVFVGTPAWTSELLRALAELAGVHLYTRTDASVWAAEGYLSIHTMSDGPLKVSIVGTGAVADAFTGRQVGNAPEVQLDAKAGDTVVLRLK